MRITMNTIFDQINLDLSRLVEKQAKTNASISSGKIYRRPSDEPVALTHALNIRSAIADSRQYSRNIQYGQGWVRATESALTQVQDRMLRAKALATQGANDSLGAGDRQALAQEVRRLMEEVVALGNTKMGDRYVLAGTKTKGYASGEAPFVLNGDGTVTYNGNREELRLTVADGLQQKINLDGHEALVQTGVFDALDLLYDGLQSNSQADIEVALGDIDNAIGLLNNKIAGIGAMENTLSNKEEMAQTLENTDRERLADIEETDIIEAVTDLKAQETAYQAALASASRVMNLSLVDYIR